MQRVLIVMLGLFAAFIILPPLWFTLAPEEPPSLPAPGIAVTLPSGNVINALDSGGNGPAVVLVHGLPGTAYDWRALTPLLAEQGFRVIAIDRVGYGHSSARVDADFRLRANTRDLLELLTALDLQRATVVGWSYGGVMAMDAVTVDPSRIARIVLVGSGGPSSDDDEPPQAGAFMRFFYSEPVLRWRASVPPISRTLMSVLSEQAYSGGGQPAWWMPGLVANFSRWETTMSYRGELLAPIETLLDVAAIDRPVLIVHAEDDRLAPVTIGRYLSEKIPDADYLEVAGGSHMLPVTHAPLLADRIADFIQTDSTAP